MGGGLQSVAVSLTDVGQTRTENQDSWGEFERDGERLLIVADGMGGHRGGATASRLCVESVARVFKTGKGDAEERLRRGFDLANKKIYASALKNARLRGMGTTAVAALFSPCGRTWVGWIGDSRAYLHRAGCLELLTADHSLVAEWIRGGILSGDEGENHPRRNELTRAIGFGDDVEPDVVELDVEPGDILLLCSDGLWGVVSEEQIGCTVGSLDPAAAARVLVETANANGGPDNVTVQLLAIRDAVESSYELGPAGADRSVTGEPGRKPAGSTARFRLALPKLPRIRLPKLPRIRLPKLPRVRLPKLPRVRLPKLPRVRLPKPPRVRFPKLPVGAAVVVLVLSLGFVLAHVSRTGDGTLPDARSVAPKPVNPQPAARASKAAPIGDHAALRGLKELLTGGVAFLESLNEAVLPQTASNEGPKEPAPREQIMVPPSPPAPRTPLAASEIPTARAFDLEPEVHTFVDTWLEAVSTTNHPLYYSLGFRDSTFEFRRAYADHEKLRLVDAEVVDVSTRAPVRIYLRVVLSYVFEDARGRFRTEDTYRFILEDTGSSLVVVGSWQ
ncbi:MAG: protein phosphatase 2C domain-containing protein [Myxococcota bacterium]